MPGMRWKDWTVVWRDESGALRETKVSARFEDEAKFASGIPRKQIVDVYEPLKRIRQRFGISPKSKPLQLWAKERLLQMGERGGPRSGGWKLIRTIENEAEASQWLDVVSRGTDAEGYPYEDVRLSRGRPREKEVASVTNLQEALLQSPLRPGPSRKTKARRRSGRIAKITKAYIRTYSDTGQVKSYVEWIDEMGKTGRTEGSGPHMQALFERARREGVPVEKETW